MIIPKNLSILNNDNISIIPVNRAKMNLEENNFAGMQDIEASSNNINFSIKQSDNRLFKFVSAKNEKKNVEIISFDDFSFLDIIIQFKCKCFSTGHNSKIDKFYKYGQKFKNKLSLEHIVKLSKKLDLLCHLLLETHQVDLMKYSVLIKKKDKTNYKLKHSLKTLKISLNSVYNKIYEIIAD